MTKSDKKFLGVVIIVAVVIATLLSVAISKIGTNNDEGSLGGRSRGDSGGKQEAIVFSGTMNIVSVSADGSNDFLVYEAEPTIASFSIGDVVSFYSASTSLPSGLSYDTYYYVVSVSDESPDRFEVSTTKDGSNIGTIGSSSGGEFAFEEFAETGRVDVSGLEHILVDFNTEEGASLTICFLASNMNKEPNWYEAKSTTNRYEHVGVIDAESGTEIEGDTCVRVDDTDTNETYQISPTKGWKWLMPISGNFASGSVDVRVGGY